MREVAPNSFIVEFPDTLSSEQCQAICTGFDALHIEEYGPSALGKVDDRRCYHAPLDHALKTDEAAFVAVHEAIKENVQKYRRNWDILAKAPVIQSALLVQKYEKGDGYYKLHVDAGHPSVFDRLLAMLVYLNDVEEGGETHFPYLDALIRPERGKLVIFPVNWPHLHAGQTPVSNDKYILTGFIRMDVGQAEKPAAPVGSWSASIGG